MEIRELESKSLLYCTLNDSNEFIIPISMNFHGVYCESYAKLDTGAVGFLVPLNSFGFTDKECLSFKETYIQRQYPVRKMQGIERTFNLSLADYSKLSVSEKLKYNGVSFTDNVNNVVLNHLSIGTCKVSVNTNIDTGKTLLGMSILKNFDFHVGTSRVTGKCTFIGCPKDKISNEYLQALSKHFGYVYPEWALSRFIRGEYNPIS